MEIVSLVDDMLARETFTIGAAGGEDPVYFAQARYFSLAGSLL